MTGRFDDPLLRPPPVEALDWVAASAGPGAEVVSARRLTGGRWHANHVVTVREPAGGEQELVLRRWARPEWKSEDPDFTPEREAVALELLGPSPVVTPRVIDVDPGASACDAPALLTDKLPGDPPGQPRDMDAFVRQLAEVLPAIHAIDGEARLRLPEYRRYNDDVTSSAPPAWACKPDVWRRACAVAAGVPPLMAVSSSTRPGARWGSSMTSVRIAASWPSGWERSAASVGVP